MLPTSSKKTASKKLESIKFVGGSKFMKELQKTVFFSAYDSVVFLSGRSMTEKEQKEMLRTTSIIGSAGAVLDEMTLPEQMVLGLNQFSHLYDEEVDIDINDDRNALSSSVSEGGVVDRHGGGSTEEGGEMISSPQWYDKKLKDCFFPQKSSCGKLAIYANKPDGITKSLLMSCTATRYKGSELGVQNSVLLYC
ncbi:hypothetical protein MHU86_18655 [Fragilaria crotonensis]|nr:hypothetical protein MHU86_18655 [Fragilaria crotonensis]